MGLSLYIVIGYSDSCSIKCICFNNVCVSFKVIIVNLIDDIGLGKN